MNREVHLCNGEVVVCKRRWWYGFAEGFGYYEARTIGGQVITFRMAAVAYIVRI